MAQNNQFMMAAGMPIQGMQRPQPGNENDHMLVRIMEELRKMQIPQGTWHATIDVRERANYTLQMYVVATVSTDFGVRSRPLQKATTLTQLQPDSTICASYTASGQPRRLSSPHSSSKCKSSVPRPQRCLPLTLCPTPWLFALLTLTLRPRTNTWPLSNTKWPKSGINAKWP